MAFSVLACTVAYLLNEFWLNRYFEFPGFIPTIIGTALAFFIGFNNNQAYDRWWEARKIWGSIVNNSRTWTRQVLFHTQPNANIPPSELSKIQKTLVKRHIAFLYCLKAYLRRSDSQEYHKYLSEKECKEVISQTNVHNAILSNQSKDLERLYQNNSIDGFKFIEFSNTITKFCDDMGRSERIRNTVFPTTYIYYSKVFIWLFVYSATMSIGSAIGIWSVVFGSLIGYIFFTIHAIGQILIDPFEDIPTGIPLDQITRTIEINLLEMLDEESIPAPVESVKGEYVM